VGQVRCLILEQSQLSCGTKPCAPIVCLEPKTRSRKPIYKFVQRERGFDDEILDRELEISVPPSDPEDSVCLTPRLASPQIVKPISFGGRAEALVERCKLIDKDRLTETESVDIDTAGFVTGVIDGTATRIGDDNDSSIHLGLCRLTRYRFH